MENNYPTKQEIFEFLRKCFPKNNTAKYGFERTITFDVTEDELLNNNFLSEAFKEEFKPSKTILHSKEVEDMLNDDNNKPFFKSITIAGQYKLLLNVVK